MHEFTSVRAINRAVELSRGGKLQGKNVYARIRNKHGACEVTRVSRARTRKGVLEVRFCGEWRACAWSDVYTN